jgi:hypothetical protein
MWTRRREVHLCDLETAEIRHSWRFEGHPINNTYYPGIVFIKPAGSDKYIAWDIEKNRPSAEFGHVLKYRDFNFLPGYKQAIVPAAEIGKHCFLNLADGELTPFPDRSCPAGIIYGSALLDCRINLIGDANGRLIAFDYLTGRETASVQLPGGQKLEKGDQIALSPEGRYACVQTEESIYFLRLVHAPAARKQP